MIKVLHNKKFTGRFKPLNQKDFKTKVVADLGYPISPRNRRLTLECIDCTKEFDTDLSQAKRTGRCKSCSNRKNNIEHGMTNHAMFSVWNSMMYRCNNKKSSSYKNYGAIGIQVSKEFRDVKTFISYVEHLPNYGKHKVELDRVDNSIGYRRGNLRWTTRSIQTCNSRILRSTNTSGYRGVSKKDGKWVARIGINNKSIHIGTFDAAKLAGRAYDEYVTKHKLNHTVNGV